jgi:hypothetical protein
MIVFAALVIMPLLLEILLARDKTRLAGWVLMLQLPAGILLALAFALPPGALAAFAILPWVALTGLMAVVGLTATLLGGGRRSLGRRCEDVALIFASVGGVWVLVDRMGLRPLKFDAAIVALTAVHFHYAGIVLPALTGFVIERFPDSRLAAKAAIGVVLGVPAVAVGITFRQLGWGPAFETAAGCGLALAGMLIAVLHVRVATEEMGSVVSRGLLGMAGVTLFFGMFLAGNYALRSTALPLPRLDIPAMRALHGTINAIGFGLCGVLGWRRLLTASSRAQVP